MEHDLVNFALGVDGADGLFQVGYVPEMENFVFSSGGQVLGVRGNCDSVDLSIVGFEGVSDLEVGVPDFESAVPADRGEVGLEGDFSV